MPENDPRFGEIWSTTDPSSGRIAQGIVADVSPIRVLMVSLTGGRVPVAPQRLPHTWRFVQGTPRRALPRCMRQGCGNAGMVHYRRQDADEYVCARHTPQGIQCQLTTTFGVDSLFGGASVGDRAQLIRASSCPMCGGDDPFEHVLFSAPPAHLWQCVACNIRWVTIPPLPPENDFLAFVNHVRNEVERNNLTAESVLIPSPDQWMALRRRTDIDSTSPGTIQHGNLSMTFAPNDRLSDFIAFVRVRNPIQNRNPMRGVQRLGGLPNPEGGRERVMAHNFGMFYGPTPDVAARADTLRRMMNSNGGNLRGPDQPQNPESIPDVAIDKGSRWIQRASGDIVEVQDIARAIDDSDIIVFRRVLAEEDIEPVVRLTPSDFLLLHRPFTEAPEAAVKKPPIEVAVGEEWESKDGGMIVVTSVDERKEIVFADDTKTNQHRRIPFVQFAVGRWRKIVRRSAYDRLRKPEVGGE